MRRARLPFGVAKCAMDAGTGVHCSMLSCKRLDFLPFTCELCRGTFCKEHARADSHNCRCLTPKVEPAKVQLVVLEKGLVSLPLVIVEGAVSVVHGACVGRTPLCSVAECGRRDQVEVICPHCDRRLCLVHRHPEDHACLFLPLHSASATSRGCRTKKTEQPTTSKKMVGGRLGAKSDSLSAKVALMKLKQKAEGPQSIPQSERVYFTVNLPASCRVQSVPLFFSKEWAVGKVVDDVSRKFNISNHNNLSNYKKLVLYAPDGTTLLPSRALHSYLELLPSGSSITIDYAR